MLAKLTDVRRYTLCELQQRPLPEGVDAQRLEMYLDDEEFEVCHVALSLLLEILIYHHQLHFTWVVCD